MTIELREEVSKKEKFINILVNSKSSVVQDWSRYHDMLNRPRWV